MTSQYRHRRTSNPATVFTNPLEPGEIAVNTANRQIAVGDAASGSTGAPLNLLAVQIFDTRAQYPIGSLVTHTGVLYRAKVAVIPAAFDISQWEMLVGAIDPQYVAVAGDQMTGPLELPAAAPTLPVQATNKAYVDAMLAAKSSVIVAAAPPTTPTPIDSTLWYDTIGGQLYIRYNDGNTVQWVIASPQPDASQYTYLINASAVRYDAAQALTVPQKTQARVNIGVEQSTRFINSGYDVTAADNNAMIICTAGSAINLPSGATLGDKFKVTLRYTGTTSWVWIQPASGTINGRVNIRLFPGETCTIWCHGTDYVTTGLSMGLVKLGDQVVTNSGGSGWQNIMNDEFTDYQVRLRDVSNIGACTSIVARASQGGVVNASNAYHYGIIYVNSTSSAFDIGSTSSQYFHIIDTGMQPGGGSGLGLSSVIDLPGWGIASNTLKLAHIHTVQRNNGGIASYLGGGLFASLGVCDGIVFYPNAGTFSAGMTLLGVRA